MSSYAHKVKYSCEQYCPKLSTTVCLLNIKISFPSCDTIMTKEGKRHDISVFVDVKKNSICLHHKV